MRRIVLLLVAIAGLAGSLVAFPASASEDWCFDDPVIIVGGRTFALVVGVNGTPEAVRSHVSEAEIVVYVPPGATATLALGVDRYFRETVRFEQEQGLALPFSTASRSGGNSLTISFSVTVHASKAMQTSVQVTEVLSLDNRGAISTYRNFGITNIPMIAALNAD